MAHRSPILAGAALAFVVLVIVGYAQADDKCRTGCKGGAHTFKYAEGTTYKYNFDSKIEITLSSAEGQKTSTEVKAQVLLTQQSQCNQVLRLQDVQIIGADGKKHAGSIPDVDKPIQLNFHDGHLEDSICITPGDTQNSLNIKRAVASLFQANLKNGHETDVFGLCQTEVNHHNEGSFLVVQKSRNLNKCAYRESIKQDFLSTALNLNSEIRSSPILNADYNGKLRIKNGILDQAVVTENYLYVPFSVGNNGAKAVVETKLQFAGTAKDNTAAAAQTKCSQPRSIIFEDPHPVNSPKSNVNSILAAVKETAKTVGLTVGENTAKEFVNLIKILRVSNKDDLLAVYNQVRAGVGFADKDTAKKLFLDALLRAGNGDTVEVAIELLKNKELNPIEQKLVFFGLSLVRHTTEASLNAAVGLLNQPNLPREAYLGIGTLAGRHCLQHSCKNVDAVNKLIQTFVSKLGDGKASTRQDENDIIYALKGLANINRLNDAILSKLTAIAQDKKASNRLRVTALETYLADACKDKLRDSALGILKDIQQDSEIRIKAYLALAQCPNAKIGNAVKTMLENEPSYQVGGFIASHIRNIRSSANPDKELAKQHLGFINLPKKFPVDLRKYSYNGEFSYSIDTLGVASSLEGNIIYSQQSFLPRTTSFNLTAEVFGHSFNFLEMNMRQENLDKLLEHYFGPQGLLRTTSLQELYDSKGKYGKELYQNLKERVEKSLRARRDVSKAEIDQIGKQVQMKTNELNKNLDLDWSVKVFGSELAFINVNDDARKFTPEAIIDRIIDELNKGLDNLKNFQHTLRSNILFLDVELAYPTSTGFPLRLGVEGSSHVQVKASGNIDIRALLNKDSTIKLSLIPSGNVQVSGLLTLDSLLVENGLKVISNLHTATGSEIAIEFFKKEKGIDVKLSLPLDKQNLISASHDIVFHSRDLGAPEVNSPLKFAQNKEFTVCLDQLSPIIGLTFCGDINGPNLSGKQVPVLPFPFAGSAKVSVTIEKDDLSEYHFRAVEYGTAEKIGAEIDVETYNKANQKKVSLQVEAFLVPEKYIRVTLVSPIKKALLEGRITTNSNEKSVSVKFSHDTIEYFGKIGVSISGNDVRAVYKPILEYKTPQDKSTQIPPYHVEGEVVVEKSGDGAKYILDNVRVVIPNQKTININGNFGQDGKAFFSDLQLGDGTHTGNLKGRIQAEPNHLKFNVELQNTMNPQANLNVKGELKKSPEDLDGSLQIVHGKDLSSKTNVLSLAAMTKRRWKSSDDFNIALKNKFSYPLLGVDAKLEFEHQPKKMEYDVGFQYNEMKLGSEMELEYNMKTRGDYDVDFGIWGLGQRLEIDAKRQLNGEESKVQNSLEINGKKFEVNGKIKHHIKPQDINVGCDLEVKVPSQSVPLKVTNGLVYNPNEIDFFEKVVSGNTIYCDVFLKANKAGSANGAVKINLNKLIVNGQLKANKGNGNADIVIDMPALKKQLKADGTFTIHDPTYNIVVNIYPISNEDQSKKLTFSTQNKITVESVNSKNVIDILGHKLEVNAKGTRQGELNNGKLSGEVEIHPPNNHYLSAKFSREVHTDKDVMNGQGMLTLEHRENENQAGAKFNLKATFRNTNPKERVIDADYAMVVDNGQGKTLNVDLGVKRQKNGDERVLEIKQKLYGSVLTNPIETAINVRHKIKSGSYQITSSCGSNSALDLKGSYDFTGDGKPITGDVNLDVKLPFDDLQSLKVGGSGSLQKGEYLDAKGSGLLFAQSKDRNLVDVKGNGEVSVSDKNGKAKGMLNLGNQNPVSLDLGYSRHEDDKNKKVQGNVALQYGNNENVKADLTLAKLSEHEYKLDLKFDMPTKSFRSNHLQVHTKRSSDGKNIQSDVELMSDGKTWTLNSNMILSDLTPTINIQGKCPDGKLVQLYAKVNKMSDKQLGAELKLINQHKDFVLESLVDANVETIDDFHIKVNIHCPAIQFDKVLFEAQNKPTAKTGRRIQVVAKSGSKNLLSGSTSYQSREEKGKLIIEGSGSFKVKDETKSANFKYIRQNLVQDKNGENGIQISFDAGLGNKAIDAELKITNKQFRILNSYCEEKKQCAHVEVDSKTNIDENLNLNQELEIAVDLRKLGLSHEFGLKAVTNRKGYVLDHTVDIHFQSQENSKYQYSLYLHPHEAGVSFTTPKRVVALEANCHLPKSIKNGGKASGEVVFYLDKKNQPKQKTSLVGYLNVDAKDHNVEGEAKFTTPGLGRPLTVKGKSHVAIQDNQRSSESTVEFDIFAQPNQKLVVTSKRQLDWTGGNQIGSEQIFHVKSQGLNVDIKAEETMGVNKEKKSAKFNYNFNYHVGNSKYLSAFNWQVSPESIEILLRALNIDLLTVNTKMQLSKDHQLFNSEVGTHGVVPLVSQLEVKNWNTLKFNVARKNTPNNKLQINSGLIPGQIADFRAEVVKDGATHDLLHATVKLDDANFLKSDYGLQAKNIEEYLLKTVKNDISNHLGELRNVAQTWTRQGQEEVKQFGEILKKAQPNLQPMKEYYAKELNELKEEIIADKNIKDLSELFHNILRVLSQTFGNTITQLNELIEDLYKRFSVIVEKLLGVINNELFPKLQEILSRVLQVSGNILSKIGDVVLTYIAKVTQILEKYQPELKQICTTVSEVSQDVGRVVLKAYERISKILLEQWRLLYNEIKALPIFEELKAQYSQFIEHGLPNREALVETFKDAVQTIRDVAPTDELKHFIELVGQYLEKKLTNQQVDDVAALDQIFNAALAVVKKVNPNELFAIQQHPESFDRLNIPFSLSLLSKLPRLVAVKFSPVAYLLREDTPGMAVFIASLINNPRNWVPPFPLYGIVIQGQHIFTFDGRHLTFPGKCNYLLARDAVNGNFTVVGTYGDDEFAAITLSDKSGNVVTLKKGGQVLLNGQPTELPARKPSISAFRNYERIELVSTAGVHVICGPELIVCSVRISGFYHGQVRGLLGNGNNEPYDDFTMPNGKIVTSESDFGNAYKMSTSCPAVKTVDHQHHHSSSSCDKLFSWDSELRYCYPFVNTENFKIACEHGVAAGIKDTERAIAVGYVAKCNQHAIPIRVPPQFVQCHNGDQAREIGDTFSVKVPGKVADIVLLIDTDKVNEPVYKELVQPLVHQLTTELSTKGISDIDFHLITWGGENQWPSHITVNGKMNFKDNTPNLKFSPAPPVDKLDTGCSRMNEILETIRSVGYDLKLALGTHLEARTYEEGLNYPFRAHATKSVIAVVSRPCEIGTFFPLQILRTLLYRKKTTNLNLITPFEKITIKDKHAKDIVGFNAEQVFTLSAKKSKASAELHKELDYSDFCVDFTVNNRGNVFVTDNFLQAKGAARKQFVQTTAYHIVEQLTNVEQGLDCECKYTTPFTAQNVCQVVSSKDKVQAGRKGTAKG